MINGFAYIVIADKPLLRRNCASHSIPAIRYVEKENDIQFHNTGCLAIIIMTISHYVTPEQRFITAITMDVIHATR